MIGSVRGVLLDRMPSGEVTVEVGGVGYRSVVAQYTIAAFFYDTQNNQIVSNLPQSQYSSKDGKLSVC